MGTFALCRAGPESGEESNWLHHRCLFFVSPKWDSINMVPQTLAFERSNCGERSNWIHNQCLLTFTKRGEISKRHRSPKSKILAQRWLHKFRMWNEMWNGK